MSVDFTVHFPQQGALSDLAGWLAGDLGTAYARLYSNNVAFLPTNTLASYTEAAFPGYAPVGSLGWSVPYVNGQGKAQTDSNPVLFRLNSNSGSYAVYGLYITDSANSKLLAVLSLLQPFLFTASNNELLRMLSITCVSEL